VNIRTPLVAAVAAGVLLLATGCPGAESEASKKGKEARNAKVASSVACGQTGESLECRNLKKRLDRYENPSKISYIYLLADTGGIYAYFTVKGKVSSNLSQMLPEDTLVDGCNRSGEDCPQPLEAVGDDGSYGPNEDGIFFFTTDDVLVTWNGKYLLADAPLKIDAAELVLQYAAGSKPTK
jgi:hypothetical protein